MSKTEVREFWIGFHGDGDAFILDKPKKLWRPQIHVIEMSAYLKLQEELATLKKQLDEHLKVHDMTCPYPDCNRMFWADFRDESRKPKGLAFVVTPKNPIPKVRKELEKELEEARRVIERIKEQEIRPQHGKHFTYELTCEFLTKWPKDNIKKE